MFEAANKPLPQDIKPLTSLRFFAAFWVVLYHFRINSDLPIDQVTQLVAKGFLGVDLFFVLSGFILFHVYFQAKEAGKFHYGRFLTYRFSRLYPIHFVTMLGALVLVVGANMMAGEGQAIHIPLSHILSNLFMVHGWGVHDTLTLNYPAWSISAEWFAYMCFPAFLAIGHSLRARPVVFLGLSIAVFGALAWLVSALGMRPITELSFDFSPLRIVPEFMVGCAIYLLAAQTTLNAPLARLLLIGSVLGWVASLHFGLADLLIVAIQCLVIFAFAQTAKHGATGLMDNRVLVYLGEVSYSVYMVHALVQVAYYTALRGYMGWPEQLPLWLWLPAPLLVIIAAMAGYHLVEKPGRSVFRRLADRLFPR